MIPDAVLMYIIPKKSLTPAPTTNGAGHVDAPPAPNQVTYLESALALVDRQLANTEQSLHKLREQREHIAAALGEDYIPF